MLRLRSSAPRANGRRAVAFRAPIPPGGSFADVKRTLGPAGAAELDQYAEKGAFFTALDRRTDDVWRARQAHFKQQDALIDQHGVEGALREHLKPSAPSKRGMISGRKPDLKVLEEIHRECHGKHAERRLRKGAAYERFVAQETNNMPIVNASLLAKKTFGMGGSVRRIASARSIHDLPVSNLPEIAVVGRTNSGKSALINALTNNFVCPYGHLAGTTQSLDFLRVADRLMLVDCPGWGHYNIMQSNELDAANAQKLVRAYLRTASPDCADGARRVVRVLVCIPADRGVCDPDWKHLELLRKLHVPCAIVITKTDVEPALLLAKRVTDLREQVASRLPKCREILLTGSLRMAGITPLQDFVAGLTFRSEQVEDDLDVTELV